MRRLRFVIKKIFRGNVPGPVIYIKNLLHRNKVHLYLAGSNNTIMRAGAFLDNVSIEIQGNDNEIEISKDARISNTEIVIQGNHHRLRIGSCRIGNSRLCLEDSNCEISIGNGTSIESAHIASVESFSRIIIGEDCMLADDIQIRTSDYHSIVDLSTGKRINPAKNILISDHVWLGLGVQVLKGVTIGHDTMVGAKSLVTHTVPNNSVVAGVPAKIIKRNVSWNRDRI